MGYIPHLLRIKWFLILKMRVPFNQECSVPIKKRESPSTKNALYQVKQCESPSTTNALYQVKNVSPLQPRMLCTKLVQICRVGSREE